MSPQVQGPEPGWWASDWWLSCRDGPLGRVVDHKETGWARLDQIQVPLLHLLWRRPVSDGHARLSVACLHHAVSPGTQTPRSQERSAKHSVGGLGEKTETLGRAVTAVHQMLAARASEDIKSDGRHGSMRVSKVVDGWIYSVREKVVGPKKEKGIARLEIEQTGLEILS